MKEIIENLVNDHIKVVEEFKNTQLDELIRISNIIADKIVDGKKILICGNGGSATASQHFSGELVGRFEQERQGLPCISLTSDNCILTAIGNDYGFENIFSRQIESIANEGDVLIALSTSGKSPNIVKAMKTAEDMGLFVVLFTGINGASNSTNSVLYANSIITARIQEVELLALHIIAKIVEDRFC